MKKKFVLIFVLLLLIIFIFIASLSKKGSSLAPTFGPTPTAIPLPTNTSSFGLAIISSDPKDGSANIDVNQKISITFNKPLTAKDFIFALGPETPYTTAIEGSMFVVTPTNPLLPGNIYKYVIRFSDTVFSQSFSFTTAGAGPVLTPAYDNVANMQAAWDKKFAPDLFLTSQVPYQTADFSVTYNLVDLNTPQEHYAFFITLTGSNTQQDKQEFLTWLKSFGLGDTQMQQLDLRYQ